MLVHASMWLSTACQLTKLWGPHSGMSYCCTYVGLSSRERNLLKRKSRALNRSGSTEGSGKRPKTGNTAVDAATEQAEAEEDGQEWQAVAAGQWPFQVLCDQMCFDVLDPVWEVSNASAACACACANLYAFRRDKPAGCYSKLCWN